MSLESPIVAESSSAEEELAQAESDEDSQYSAYLQHGDDNELLHSQNELANQKALPSSFRQAVAAIASNWKILLFGQAISLLFASQGVAQATLHLSCNLSAPAFATGLVYLVLSFNVIPLLLRGQRKRNRTSGEGLMKQAPDGKVEIWLWKSIPLQASPWAYFAIALLDVEASYATVLAYKFTTLTSASVFDAVAIPSAMILSRLILKRSYRWIHLVGVAICLAGILAMVFIDYETDVQEEEVAQEEDEGEQVDAEELEEVEEYEEYPHRLLGDCLAIVGGVLFGARDVLTEKTIREVENSTVEYLGMIGIFGTLISIVQVFLVERNVVANLVADSACSVPAGVFLFGAYMVTCGLQYWSSAAFLFISEAALLNLSLLTADLWSAVFSVVDERIIPPPMFWLALFLILGGVLVYEVGPSPIVEEEKPSYPEEGVLSIREDPSVAGSVDFCDPEGSMQLPNGVVVGPRGELSKMA